MGKRHGKLTLLHHTVVAGLGIIAISGTRGEVRLRQDIIRDVTTTRATQFKFNEVSDLTCFFRLPPRLALRTPDSSELINITPAEISSYFKQGKQQRNDENTDKTEDEKRHFLKLLPSVKQRYKRFH